MATDRRAVGSNPPLRLLVVDDDPSYRSYVVALVRRLGFWVDAAVDGESALERLRQGSFDIIIVDYEMPRLTGPETITRIREDELLRGIYAVMLTGREDLDSKLTALEAGFDDFLSKASPEPEIVAKMVAAKRVVVRQRTMSTALRDLYGLAIRDDLTGVFNRRYLIAEAERLLLEGVDLTLVLIDLDEFKQINDTFGHLAGDDVLRDVGASLQAGTRSEDVVSRFGGDEFIVLMPHLDPGTGLRVAERLEQSLSTLEWHLPEIVRITASTGVASSTLLENPTVAQLVNAADRDMYKNKWIRKHPDLRPELYEYPTAERGTDRLLVDIRERDRRDSSPGH